MSRCKVYSLLLGAKFSDFSNSLSSFLLPLSLQRQLGSEGVLDPVPSCAVTELFTEFHAVAPVQTPGAVQAVCVQHTHGRK